MTRPTQAAGKKLSGVTKPPVSRRAITSNITATIAEVTTATIERFAIDHGEGTESSSMDVRPARVAP
jgi:hypothetical protein